MDIGMQLYWKLYFDTYQNDEIIDEYFNPVREYEKDLIEGPVLDIGCGQSALLLEYARKGRQVVGVDNEPLQLDLLKQRVENEKNHRLDNWDFVLGTFPQTPVPDHHYSLIILSNLLHFFTLEQCVEVISKISINTKPGTLIYVKVHSHKHYVNNPDDPLRHFYFKHFFTSQDLGYLFKNGEYERIYLADIDKEESTDTKQFTNAWLDKVCEYHCMKDPQNIQAFKEGYMLNKSESDLVAVFRRL